MQAALAAGLYIPHLCYHPEFKPHGSCKVCTREGQRPLGRLVHACRPQAGMEVESNTEELNDKRRTLVQMLFVEGNHFCPSCEKSGNCKLQAVAYELGMMTPHFDHFFPDRPVDASHPEILLDFNRCILCELCVRASSEVDGKNVFALSGRGINKHLIVNAESGRLADTDIAVTDKARRGLPGGRDPAEARRLRGADRRSAATTASRSAARRCAMRRGRSTASRGERSDEARPNASSASRRPRWPAASAATCRCSTSTSACSTARARRVRPLAAHRHQALRPVRRRPHRGRHLQRRERARAARVPQELQDPGRRRRLRHQRRPAGAAQPPRPARLPAGGLPDRAGLASGGIPNDPELPLPLDKVHPLHEVVKIDYFLPGCPPSADAIWKFLTDLLAGRTPHLGHGLIHLRLRRGTP